MQVFGFELGSPRAEVYEKVVALQFPIEETGDMFSCQGQMFGMDATMSWAFKNGRLYNLHFLWLDSVGSMTLEDNDVYRALSARYGAINREESATTYVRWTSESGYIQLGYAKRKEKIRNTPWELVLSASLYVVPEPGVAEVRVSHIPASSRPPVLDEK